MTVKAIHDGQDSTGPFTFDWLVSHQSELLLMTMIGGEATTLAYGVDYTVSGVGNPNGGEITLTEVLASGDELFMFFDPEYESGVQFTGATSISKSSLDGEFKRVYRILSLLRTWVTRSMHFAEPFNENYFDATLPAGLVGSASVVVATNEDGDGFIVGPSVEMIEDAEAIAEEIAEQYGEMNASQTFTQNTSNNNFTDEIYDPLEYSSIRVVAEITRGVAIFGHLALSFFYHGGAWNVIEGVYTTLDSLSEAHGLTFNFSGNQLRVSVDNSGAGNATVKLKKAFFTSI